MIKRGLLALLFLLSCCFLQADQSTGDTSRLYSSKPITYHPLEPLAEMANLGFDIDSLIRFVDAMGERLNGTLIIARNDTIILERAYGYLQLYQSCTNYRGVQESQLESLRLHPDNKMWKTALFDLASISKQFTAAAILKLCSEGKLSLQDTLGKLVPELPYKKVTVRHLLTHTSGIPEYFNFKYDIFDTSTFVDNAQLIRVLKRERYPLDYPSGTRFEYRNTNYAILATIVERVSGITFEDYVHDHLFEPAGMHDTFFFTELIDTTRHWPAAKRGDIYTQYAWINPEIPQPVTRGHKKNGILALYDRFNGILGDKGIYSNVEDMIRWTNAYFIQYEILPEEWVAKASTRQNTLSNGILPKQSYGYGLRLEESPTHGLLVYHGGLWDGYQNLWLYRPKDKVQIVFLSNYYNGAHAGKSDGVLNIIDNLISHDR
ncbi:MAG: beta-lactamase family protein [Bacteroidales bacterium]|nr:beta-lactamase family protein [Bacteroidales bacterium]